jgi:hypothetical protein
MEASGLHPVLASQADRHSRAEILPVNTVHSMFIFITDSNVQFKAMQYEFEDLILSQRIF